MDTMPVTSRRPFTAPSPFLLVTALLLESTWARPVVRDIRSAHSYHVLFCTTSFEHNIFMIEVDRLLQNTPQGLVRPSLWTITRTRAVPLACRERVWMWTIILARIICGSHASASGAVESVKIVDIADVANR